jgi:hypothetical protein
MAAAPSPVNDALHIARSRLIDAHAAVEQAIAKRLARLGIERQQLCGQNIEALRNAKPHPQYSKATRTRVLAQLDELGPIQEIRCDVAHARLQVVELGEETVACFINPQRCGTLSDQARLVFPAQFAEIERRLLRIAAEIAAD